MVTETYYATKPMSRVGNGRVLRIEKNWNWGFEPGDIVRFTAYPINRPRDIVNVYKKVCAVSIYGLGIYVDRSWGFEDDELIVFTLTPTDKIMV